MNIIEDFEKTSYIKNFIENFDVYYTNLGGYHFTKDNKPCFYLNGALRMYEIQRKESSITVWYDIDECKPKSMSRVLVDIGGYTQSNILIYINDVWYRDDVCERVEYSISHLISRWCYLPLSRKDMI